MVLVCLIFSLCPYVAGLEETWRCADNRRMMGGSGMSVVCCCLFIYLVIIMYFVGIISELRLSCHKHSCITITEREVDLLCDL